MLPEIAEQFFPQPQQVMNGFVPVRERTVKRILATLREDQATGPDGIPALFWKGLAKVLCRPFTVLTRRMLQEAAWPEKGESTASCKSTKRVLHTHQAISAESI